MVVIFISCAQKKRSQELHVNQHVICPAYHLDGDHLPLARALLANVIKSSFLFEKKNVAEKLDETAISPLELAKIRFHKKPSD